MRVSWSDGEKWKQKKLNFYSPHNYRCKAKEEWTINALEIINWLKVGAFFFGACVSQSWSNSSLSLRTFVSINNRKSWRRHPTGQTENLYEWIRSCRIIRGLFNIFSILHLFIFFGISEICPTTFFFFFCARMGKKENVSFYFLCAAERIFSARG